MMPSVLHVNWPSTPEDASNERPAWAETVMCVEDCPVFSLRPFLRGKRATEIVFVSLAALTRVSPWEASGDNRPISNPLALQEVPKECIFLGSKTIPPSDLVGRKREHSRRKHCEEFVRAAEGVGMGYERGIEAGSGQEREKQNKNRNVLGVKENKSGSKERLASDAIGGLAFWEGRCRSRSPWIASVSYSHSGYQ
jgi:hypothetical protein